MGGYLLSVFAALYAAMIFGLIVHIQRKGLATADPVAGALVSVATMTAAFWLAAPVFGGLEWFGHPAMIYFIAAGFAFPALGQFFQIQSVARVGPSLSAALGAFMPLFAALPAVLFLGESLTVQMGLGFAAMTGGLVFAGLYGRTKGRVWPMWALLLPLAAAAARGLVQPVSKAGMAQIPDPFFASFVMGCCSTLTLAVITLLSGKIKTLRPAESGFWWFVLVGLINGTGIQSLNLAVSSGDVTVVAPLVASAPLWTLLFSWAIFKNERLGWHHVVVAALVVTGAILVVTR